MAIKSGQVRLVAIYVLTDPDGAVRYVGRSTQPEERFAQHLREARDLRRNYYKCRWIRSLGNARPGMEILEWVPEPEAVAAEGAWILELSRLGAALTNTGTEAQGGWDVAAWSAPRRPMSDEHRENLRISRARQVMKPPSAETRAKLSAAHRGRKKSPETVERMRRARQGAGAASARLTEADVLSIRAEVASGEARRAIAEKYGVTYATVTDIVLRRRWKHI